MMAAQDACTPEGTDGADTITCTGDTGVLRFRAEDGDDTINVNNANTRTTNFTVEGNDGNDTINVTNSFLEDVSGGGVYLVWTTPISSETASAFFGGGGVVAGIAANDSDLEIDGNDVSAAANSVSLNAGAFGAIGNIGKNEVESFNAILESESDYDTNASDVALTLGKATYLNNGLNLDVRGDAFYGTSNSDLIYIARHHASQRPL